MIIHKIKDNYYCQFSEKEMREIRNGLGCTWSEGTYDYEETNKLLRDAFDEMLD